MIQPINEAEKNRIRNLHRKHFVLNEDDSLSKTKKCAIRNLKEEKVLTTEIENKINDYVDYNELADYLQQLPVGTGSVINCLTTTLRIYEPEFSLNESLLNENEEVEVDKLEKTNKPYCKGGNMENKLLSKIKSLGDEAKTKLKELYEKIEGKSVKELLGILREARKAKKSTKNLNESVGAVVIAGVSIPGGIFIAIGALIIILIIVTILNKSGRGCGNPFDRL